MRKIVHDSKQVLVLNPESRSLWNAGDSIVKYYEAVGVKVFHVATLRDLLTFVYELKQVQ